MAGLKIARLGEQKASRNALTVAFLAVAGSTVLSVE
jgi:hypothetical protein